jgi:hypothetical protein
MNIWVSDVADPCGTWPGGGTMTILDCDDVLRWPCGRFLGPDGQWKAVPNGAYKDLPFRCGHLEVELPPGCYWVVAGYVGAAGQHIHFNYTTHVGIAQVGCNETACVKIYNPTLRLCWDWFHAGLLAAAAVGGARAAVKPAQVKEIERLAEGVLKGAPQLPIEETIEQALADLTASARKQK